MEFSSSGNIEGLGWPEDLSTDIVFPALLPQTRPLTSRILPGINCLIVITTPTLVGESNRFAMCHSRVPGSPGITTTYMDSRVRGNDNP